MITLPSKAANWEPVRWPHVQTVPQALVGSGALTPRQAWGGGVAERKPSKPSLLLRASVQEQGP